MFLGRFSIDGVRPGQNNELSKVEVKVLVDIHGIVRVPSAKMAKNLTAMNAIDCQASENSSNCSNNFDTFIEVSVVTVSMFVQVIYIFSLHFILYQENSQIITYQEQASFYLDKKNLENKY